MFKSLTLLLFASFALPFTYGRSLPLLLRLRHSSPVKLYQLEEDGTLLQNGGKMASTIDLSDNGEYMLNLTMDDLDDMETDDASAMSGEDYYEEDENPIGEANYFNPAENKDYHEDDTPTREVYNSDVMKNGREREFKVVGVNDDRQHDEFSQRDEAAHLSRKRDWIITGLGDVESESLEKDFDEMMNENDQFQ